MAAELGVRMAGEGIEEGLQNILEPVFRNIAFGENNRIEVNEETWYQVLIGAITAGLLEGVPSVARNISNTRAGHAVQQAHKVDALITNAMALNPKTEAGKLAGKLADGSIHENQYNIGELLRAYVDAGGDTTFMYIPNLDTLAQSIQTRDGEIFVDDLPDVDNILAVPADVQLQNAIQSNIEANVQIHPESVQSALTQGMTALTQIEARIKADSGNVNHQGIDISASHDAYMDFRTQKGTIADTAKEARLGRAAQVMAADIQAAVASGQLSDSEVTQLQNILEGLTGDAELAAAYVGVRAASAGDGSITPMDGQIESGYNGEQGYENSGKIRIVPPSEIKTIFENEGLNQDKIDNIVALPKGKKPKPEKYLSKKYIAEHLQSFKDSGVVKIMPTEPTGTIGGKGGTFVMSGDQLDSIIKVCKGDITKVEDALGFDRGYLGNHPVIVELHNIAGLRMPEGNEIGASLEYWLPGGFTIGGIKEAVVDPAQVGTYTYRRLF